MNLYKSIFHKLVEPLNAFKAQEILDAGKQLTGCDCENCKINSAIGETVLRIGRLRNFAEFILSDEFETRAAELPDAPACGDGQVDAQDIERTTEIETGEKSTADAARHSAHG